MTTQEIQAIVERYFGKVTATYTGTTPFPMPRDQVVFDVAGTTLTVIQPFVPEPGYDTAIWQSVSAPYTVKVWAGGGDHPAVVRGTDDLDKALCEARKAYAEHLAYYVRLATLLPKVIK